MELDQDQNTWAVSFSDISTVLLMFFILLFSFSVINPHKYEMIQKSIKGANFDSTNMKQLEMDLQGVIRDANLQNEVLITPDDLGLNIEIQDQLMFASGTANINRSTQTLLDKIIREMTELPEQYRFFIEGHTDDVPIRNNREFRSNWDLSAARALTVLNLFRNLRIDDKRLRVEGFADTQPLEEYPLRDGNNNPIVENRAKNRRVVIKIR